MIRILEVENKIKAIKVLREAFPNRYSIGEAKRLLDELPVDLPHMYRWNELRIRDVLTKAGFVLDKTCGTCLSVDDNPTKCGACYSRFVHCTHGFPRSYNGPICGSMYFYTSCGANWSELGVKRPPTVREELPEEERRAIIDSVTCEECRETLGRWGYIKT